MQIKEKKETWGMRFYRLEEADKSYLAEAIFVTKKPRSRVILDVIKQLEKRIKEQRINHPAYINYLGIEQVGGDYCLLREDDQLLTPLMVYLQQEQPPLERIVDWVLTIGEIAREAEEQKLNWPGFNLRTLWVDKSGMIRLADPGVTGLIEQYRGESTGFLPEELFLPVEIFQKRKWDERGRIYSLGIIFYYLLTGKPPFTDGEKADLIDEIMHSRPVEPAYLNHKISPALNKFIIGLIAREREERPQSWNDFLKKLKKLKDKELLKASKEEEEKFAAKAGKVIKASRRKKGLRSFLRKRWKVLASSLLAVVLIVLLTLMGGTPSEVTEDTTPLQVVELFYRAIDQKDVVLLGDTTILDLKRLERMVTETHVIEKMQSAYSPDKDAAESLFGIKELKITLLEDKPQPIFQAEYIFYLNAPEEKQEMKMTDIIKLGNVEGCWRIVELKGSIEKLIQGKIEELTD